MNYHIKGVIYLNLTARPLAERLNRINTGRTAHDEYIPSLVDAVKASKVAEYMGGYDEEQERIRTHMGLTKSALEKWSYRDMAAYIADRYNSSVPVAKAIAGDLMDLLAVPMLTVYRMKQEHQAKGGSQ